MERRPTVSILHYFPTVTLVSLVPSLPLLACSACRAAKERCGGGGRPSGPDPNKWAGDLWGPCSLQRPSAMPEENKNVAC